MTGANIRDPLGSSSITSGIAILAFFISANAVIAQQSSDAAFTATKVERQYDKTGRMIRFEESSEAFRSDRSTVRSRKIIAPNGKLVEQRTIVDLSRGLEATVDGLTESITSVPLEPRTIERLKLQPNHCIADTSPTRDTLLGYDVVLVKKALPGPPNQSRSVEEWLAPELACFALKQTFFLHREPSPDDSTARIVREVTSITPGEPSDELFTMPLTYTERSLSEVMSEMSRRYPQLGPQPCADCEKSAATVKRADEVYHSKRGGATR